MQITSRLKYRYAKNENNRKRLQVGERENKRNWKKGGNKNVKILLLKFAKIAFL